MSERPPAAPPLTRGQRVSWIDLERFNDALLEIIDRKEFPVEHRLRQCLALDALCRQARFGSVTGRRLVEFLELVSASLPDEVERDLDRIERPSRIGRILFRQAAALYARRDTGPRRGVSARGRLALFSAALRFARGTGPVPRVHGLLPETTFEVLERPAGPLPAASDALLTRYFRVKLESMHFFGPTNFSLPFWDGLESLLLTFPATMWLSRAFCDRSREDAIVFALRIVDDNFGYNKLLGWRRQKWATRLLAARGDLARLIAWYSR
jgi:lysine-N-methylase